MSHFIHKLMIAGVVLVSAGAQLLEANPDDATPPPRVWELYPERQFPQLQELLKSLEEASPPTLIDQLRIEEKRDGVVVARSRRLPDIRANVQFNITAEDREDFDRVIWRQRPYNRISLQQPIYHWSALKARQRATELDLENAELSYEQNLKNRKQSVRRAFFQLLEREYSLQLARQRLEAAQRHLEGVEIAHDLGDASRSDLLRAEYHLKAEEGRVLHERQVMENIRYRLFEQTGLRLGSVKGMESKIDRMLSLDFSLKGLGEAPPAIQDEQNRILENRIAQAEKDHVIQKSSNKPNVNLVINAFQDEIGIRGDEDSITRNNFFIGIQVTWNLFDGWESKARRRIALNRKSQLTKTLELAREKLDEEFDYLLERLNQMVEMLSTRQQQIEAMEVFLEQRMVEVEQGRATRDQILDDQIDLDNAKLQYIRSVSDYFLTLSQIADLLESSESNPTFLPE